MALSLNLGGSLSKQSQESTSKTTQNETQSGTNKQFGSTVVTNLDPQTIQTLQGVIQSIAPTVGQSVDADTIRALSGQLATNLDPALVEANIQASQAAAIRNFQVNQAPQIAQFQQQVGSKGNTFSQILQTQGNVDLATMLAQISNEARLGAAAQRSADLGGAIQGRAAASQVAQSPLNALLASIATLTGARTEQQVDMTSLSNLVSNLVSQTDTKSKGRTSSFGGSAGIGGG